MHSYTKTGHFCVKDAFKNDYYSWKFLFTNLCHTFKFFQSSLNKFKEIVTQIGTHFQKSTLFSPIGAFTGSSRLITKVATQI